MRRWPLLTANQEKARPAMMLEGLEGLLENLELRSLLATEFDFSPEWED